MYGTVHVYAIMYSCYKCICTVYVPVTACGQNALKCIMFTMPNVCMYVWLVGCVYMYLHVPVHVQRRKPAICSVGRPITNYYYY